MCGIAGWMTANGAAPDRAVLDRMADALAHRGPDGRGLRIHQDTGLVQTRLAIIDLDTGDQPIVGPEGSAIVANGEVYNYIELRDEIPDAPFTTRSDSEVPLHLYRRDGLAFADALRGMVALAIHDGGHLVLHRDPFGIKPLYVAEGDFGLLFASEPQALVASGLVAAATDDGSLAEVAQLQFSCGARTPWAGIRRLLPGETLVVRSGRVVDSRRRAALPPGGPRPWTRDDALMELDRLLTDSVTLHQRSDVPYGMFLSGGVDSSVVLAMMARLNDRPVVAFTAGFPDTGVHDERDHARAVAQAAGAEHHEVAVSEDDFWAHLPAIAAAVDDPTPDYAVLPTYLLARAARAAGLKVVLSGEGGDELFGGYGRYRRAGRPRLLGGRPMRARGALDGLLRDDGGAWRAAYGATEIRDGGRTALQAAQATDIADWLPHDLLTKLDRCLMAHGVEGRVPFVDPVLADFALTLPDALKVRRGQGKWLLRAWLNTALPAARPFTPKRGFTVPVGDWIARHAADLGPRVAASPVVERLCRPGAVDGLFRSLTRGQADRRAGQAAWTLLFLALWHRAHRDGATIDGGVMDVL